MRWIMSSRAVSDLLYLISLVTLDDRTADGQTDAQAMRQQFDAVAAMNLRLNSERSRPVLDPGHCVSGIQQQVQDYLLQLNAIAADGRQRFREVCLQYRAALP
jgi:lipase chaperone LimK